MSEQEERRRQAEARIGDTLKDKWHLDQLLGVGGMASVYAATHHNQKRVAVKILHRDLSLNTEMRARFLREGYLANTVGHSGVVTVDDDNVLEDGSAFLVMELLEGETLEARRVRLGGTLPVREVLGYAERLLDVLATAHDKGIVHRDLKPDNLFVTTAGELKVLDFGIARLQEMSASSGGTRIGSIMGTPTFMAPEQARARWDEVDGRTDLFAVGATLYTLLSGRYVHEAETLNEELGLAMTARAASLATVAADLPAPVVAFVDRALAFEKAARWPDARAMRNALPTSTLLLEVPPSSPDTGLDSGNEMTTSAPPGTTRAVTGRRAAMIAGVAVVLVAGGILAPRLSSPTPKAETPGERTASAPIDVAPAESAAPSVDTATPTVLVTMGAAAPNPPVRTLTTKSDAAAPSRNASPKPSPATTPKPAPPVTTPAPSKAPPAAPTANIFDRRH